MGMDKQLRRKFTKKNPRGRKANCLFKKTIPIRKLVRLPIFKIDALEETN